MLIAATALAAAIGTAGCIKVRTLGERTGKAYRAAFTAQVKRGKRERHARPKAMEAELADRVGQRMLGDRGDGRSRSRARRQTSFVIPAEQMR